MTGNYENLMISDYTVTGLISCILLFLTKRSMFQTLMWHCIRQNYTEKVAKRPGVDFYSETLFLDGVQRVDRDSVEANIRKFIFVFNFFSSGMLFSVKTILLTSYLKFETSSTILLLFYSLNSISWCLSSIFNSHLQICYVCVDCECKWMNQQLHWIFERCHHWHDTRINY